VPPGERARSATHACGLPFQRRLNSSPPRLLRLLPAGAVAGVGQRCGARNLRPSWLFRYSGFTCPFGLVHSLPLHTACHPGRSHLAIPVGLIGVVAAPALTAAALNVVPTGIGATGLQCCAAIARHVSIWSPRWPAGADLAPWSSPLTHSVRLVLLSHKEEYPIEITWFFKNESFLKNPIISTTSSNY
jgi:hypothetical protein